MLSALSTTPLETCHNFERRKYLNESFQNGHIISGNVVLRLNYYKHIIKFSGPHSKNAVDARKLSALRTTLDCISPIINRVNIKYSSYFFYVNLV